MSCVFNIADIAIIDSPSPGSPSKLNWRIGEPEVRPNPCPCTVLGATLSHT